MRFRSVLVMVGIGVTLLGSALPAAAHTDLLQSSPASAQQVGGTVDFVDLAFVEPVSEAVVTVSFEGEELGGKTVETDGQIIRFELDEPLEAPGEYLVQYEMRSFDGDQTDVFFQFVYQPESPQPQRIGDVEPTADSPAGGRNWGRILLTVAIVGLLAGAAFMFLSRLEAKRRGADSLEDNGNSDEPSVLGGDAGLSEEPGRHRQADGNTARRRPGSG